MSLFDQFISAIAPHNCVNCGIEGRLLCVACVHKLRTVPSRCYRCRRITDSSRTCISCRKTSKLYRLQVGTIYETSAKALIWRLKYTGAQAAATEIAQLLKARIETSPKCFITPVPTATSRVRRRGYDQAKLLARAFAKQQSLPYLNCLARSGQTHQIGARRQQRLKQLLSAFRVTSSVKGKHIILVDDVSTTGASLEAAATCLKMAGAKRVEAIVFAQA